MNASMMQRFSGMNGKADEAGFIAVYPNGTGAGPFLTFNSGGVEWELVKKQPNDVTFVSQLLDDLATVVSVDPKRIYATGMSNGGMMCYRLAAELSDRIAAIAPVAGTMAVTRPSRNGLYPCCTFTAPRTGWCRTAARINAFPSS
jgi:polyhydroxybutyrate depolymerase